MTDKGIANSRRQKTLMGVQEQINGAKRAEKITAEITREVGVAKSTIKKWVSRFEKDDNLLWSPMVNNAGIRCRNCYSMFRLHSQVSNRDCEHSPHQASIGDKGPKTAASKEDIDSRQHPSADAVCFGARARSIPIMPNVNCYETLKCIHDFLSLSIRISEYFQQLSNVLEVDCKQMHMVT